MSDLYTEGFLPGQNIKKRWTKHTYKKQLLIEKVFPFPNMYVEGIQTTGGIYSPLLQVIDSLNS